MEQDKDLNIAIVENLRLKSRILVGIFGIILFGQIIVLFYLVFGSDLIGKVIPRIALVIGPLFLLSIIGSELFFSRRLKAFVREGKAVPAWLPYLVTFIECSFPTAFLLIASQFLTNSEVINPTQLITSPPLIMYIIMIILSSLTLDLRISVFAGFVAGAEYFLVSKHVLSSWIHVTDLDVVNTLFRSGLIFLCGLIAGLISKKIRDAVRTSLEHKNNLINKLDEMVHAKTAEIRVKNEMLEEKQLEIADSLRYAKRIQDSQLPNEKYIHRVLSDRERAADEE